MRTWTLRPSEQRAEYIYQWRDDVLTESLGARVTHFPFEYVPSFRVGEIDFVAKGFHDVSLFCSGLCGVCNR
jgi:hypothetical protein